MNRLTKRGSDGIFLNKYNLSVCSGEDFYNLQSILDRLATYEDTGLEPEEIEDLKDCIEGEEGTQGTVKDLLELVQYRKLEEQGLLIKLPCKVGDKVYVNSRTFGTYDDIEYAEAEVVSIRITKKQTFVKLRIFALGLDGMPYGCSNYPISSFGKTVFLTREEAEKALEVE